jgi:hypothetical protein
VLAVVAVTLLTSATASAAENAKVSVTIRPDGSGGMIANSVTNPADEVWSWDACSISLSSCQPFAEGRIVGTGSAPAETIFRATSSYGASALSPVWHGPVTPLVPPSVTGAVRANQLVTPLAGEWAGGWDGDGGYTQLAACLTRTSAGCIPMTDPDYVEGCEAGAAVLDPLFVGRFLRVAERQHGPNPISLLLPAWPFVEEPWAPSAVISVAFLGRIKPAAHGRRASCGAPPLVQASLSKRGVGSVICVLGCRAALVARGSKGSARVERRLPISRFAPARDLPPTRLRFEAGELAGLGGGAVKLTLRIDGRRVASRSLLP